MQVRHRQDDNNDLALLLSGGHVSGYAQTGATPELVFETRIEGQISFGAQKTPLADAGGHQ